MIPKTHSVAPTLLTALILPFTPGLVSAQVARPYAGDISPTFGSVTDTCTFEFSLHDATAGGTQIGPVIERELRVHGGLYRSELDFGPEAFEGGSRYLEVAVGCPAGTAALTTLTRRAFHPGPGTRSDRGDTEQTATQGSAAPLKAALGTAFTYQGELKQSGAPVTGSGDFQFSLWDADTGGTQIGATVPVSAVAVEGGRFTAALDFGAAAFDGDARWLEIAVDYPSSTGTFTTLTPRQPLSAAPYALQTRGIFVDDTGDVGVGTTNPQAPLHVWSDGSRSLRVRNASSSGGTAIVAEATGGTGWAAAIDAYTASPGGVGVYSFNEAESGNAFAVAAETNSPDGIAIFGHASNGDDYSTGIGLSGRSDSDYGGTGIYGEATASGGATYGVHGVSATGTGVRGENQASGNYGRLGTSTAGVLGHVGGATDYAGYFTGGRNYFEGRVGIGTDTPAHPLHVVGTAFVEGHFQIDSGHDLLFSNPSNRIYEDVDDLRLESADDIRINPADDLIVDNSTLVVDSSFNRVGIGTLAPSTDFHVAGGARVDGDLRINGGGSISFVDANTRIYEVSDDLYLEADSDIFIQPDRDISMDGGTLYVDNSVNRVGVGTSVPAAKLDVSGDIRSSGDYLYSTARTLSRWISPSSFHERHTNDNDQFLMSNRIGSFITGTDPLETTLYAQLVLPDGAHIRELWVHYRDNDPSIDLEVDLNMTYNEVLTLHSGGMVNTSGSTSGASWETQSIGVDSVAFPIVDNEDRSYGIVVSLSQDSLSAGTIYFYGCQVVYSMSRVNP